MGLPDYVEIICDEISKKFMRKKGYSWIEGNSVKVATKDIAKSSIMKVNVVCEKCLINHIKNPITISYLYFYKRKIRNELIGCNSCLAKGSKKKIGITIQQLQTEFETRGYKLLSTSYQGSKKHLKYLCLKHPERGEQSITYAKFRIGTDCFQCGVEKISGTNNHNWKGGIRDLTKYLRSSINSWKLESMKNSKFKCVLTGTKDNLIVHHLYPFHKIMEITFKELNLPIHENELDYSKDELSSIVTRLNEVHYRYPLGVALNEKIHKEFHKMYGDDESILETFFQYATDYFGKEIKGEKAEYSPKKYFTYKTTGTSKYTGVSKGSKNRFTASIGFKGKTHYLGLFESEYDAAKAYNDKAIELFGPDTAINLLAEEDLEAKEKLKYYEPVEDQTSRFHGVSLHKTDKRTANRNDLYVSRITYNNERIQIGFFPSELEAAYHYNLKAIELFGDNAKLNKFTKEEEKRAKHLATYFPHRENAETPYTSVRLDSGSWYCQFTHEGTYHYVGRFKSDAEAAVAYNYYVKKHGLDRKLNFVEQEDELLPEIKEIMEQDDRYYPHKEKGKSIYSCVKQEKNGKWSAKTKIDKKEVYIPGRYLTDKEAAIAYNEYILEHKLDKKLNKII